MSDQLKKLYRQRSSCKSKVTILQNFIKTFSPNEVTKDQITEIELRYEKHLLLNSDFDKIQTEIESLCQDDVLDDEYLEREHFDTQYYNLSMQIKCILDTFSNANTQAQADAVQFSRETDNLAYQLQNIKLPTIQLPKFNGDYLDWLEFKDSFVSLIHNNANLTNVSKFQYLRASLEAKAVQTISAIEVSNSNYLTAWNILCERYDKNQLIVFNHLKGIFDITPITKPTSKLLKELIDDLSKHLRSLKNLNLPVDSWDVIIIYLINNKLDKETSRLWEEWPREGIFPTIREFYEFLRHRGDILETVETKETIKPQNKPVYSKNPRQLSCLSGTFKCNFCNDNHVIYHCPKFLKLDTRARLSEVKRLKLCVNCLRTGHLSKWCPSSHCKYCKEKHSSLLHSDSTGEISLFSSSNLTYKTQVLLATVELIVIDVKGHQQHCRAMLDCGSQSNFMTNSLCKKLGLYKTYTNLEVSGISGTVSSIKSQVEVVIKSRCSNFQQSINCYLLETISEDAPLYALDKNELNIPHGVDLADPQFCNPGSIDLLIGAALFWNIIQDEKISLGRRKPNLIKTMFGWVVSGIHNVPSSSQRANSKVKTSSNLSTNVGPQEKLQRFWNAEDSELQQSSQCTNSKETSGHLSTNVGLQQRQHTNSKVGTNCHLSTNIDLQEQLQRFWETEEPGLQHSKQLTGEEAECETYFQNTFSKDPVGRYTVGIPFKKDPSHLGQSKSLALKRFYNMERKFHNNFQLKSKYIQFMEEYISLGHMTKLTEPIDDDNAYYLPHHGILREDSLTTKLRVVFDGSAPTTSGWSLNDLQHVGPSIQQDLLSILIRFRQHRYVFTSDITKMYRQINIKPEHRRYQRVWWRSDPNLEPSVYELNTVTYGTTSAPYLAIRCLRQQATEHLSSHPIAANAILKDFYVDDFISGSDDTEEANVICKQVTDILSKACFELRKWATNDIRVLKDIPKENHLSHLQSFGDDKIKTLGLQWSSLSDALSYKILNHQNRTTITKRMILSVVAQIYDPLGLLTPCIIIFKILLQRLWELQLSWDAPVSDELQIKWNQSYNNLSILNNLSIPRHAICPNNVEQELHGFCDASQQAYGACIYVRSVDNDGNVFVNLLVAKSKVAPLKTLSIPRLELSGALLLTKLMNKVMSSLTISTTQHFWCDSQIVLSWLRQSSNNLQTFVANRVAKIQRNTNVISWNHVRTYDNPADLASRGIQPNVLAEEELWWHGPPWLALNKEAWPHSEIAIVNDSDLPEMKKTALNCLSSDKPPNYLISRYSNLIKLIRVTSMCLRFINNCKLKGTSKQSRKTNILSIEELKDAFDILIRVAQLDSFSSEIAYLKRNKTVKPSSSLISLAPFIDDDGFLRVGGRLQNSQLKYESQHQILLSSKHPLTLLIFENEHRQHMHVGPQMLLSSIREKFWVINGRNLARKVVHNCTKCFKADPKSLTQFMGSLPAPRVQRSFPFQFTGTDYAGPFFIKPSKGRGVKRFKCYICIFVCLSTKAMHLEAVTDLTTDSFLATLNRFISRRGKPSIIYSDNGTTYVGASSELDKIYQFLHSNLSSISNDLANKSIAWKFIPALSPNHGGLWEAAVKSVKYHLKRVLADTCVTYEQFTTILTGIEAILNSRPLSAMSNNPNDLEPLCPSHFLIGRKLMSIPPANHTLKSAKGINFGELQQLQNDFWARWSKEYLAELQHRRKWRVKIPIQIGTLVLLRDDNLPPFQWKLGRIIEVHPGTDNLVRVVTVKTNSGTYKRTLTKLCPLPVNEEEE